MANSNELQPVDIVVVKRRALRLKARKGIQHRAALSEIARSYGFSSYDHYHKWMRENHPQMIGDDDVEQQAEP